MFVTINQGIKIFLLLLVLPVFGNIVLAQSSQSANVATVVNKRVITLGEQIELTIAYRYPLTVLPSSFPGISDSFPHFEVVHRLKADTSISGEFRQVAQKLLITSFDSGHWTIPPFTLTVGNRSYKSDTIGIDVMTVELTGTQYHDIKEIIEVKAPPFDWLFWGGIALSVILVTALLWYYLKHRKKPPVIETRFQTRLGALEQALQDLEKLKKSGLHEKGEMKAFYTKAGEILKIFLERKIGKGYMQFTTDETLISLKDKFKNASDFSSFAEVLRIADAVKFAKYSSSPGEANKSLDILEASVKELNQQKT